MNRENRWLMNLLKDTEINFLLLLEPLKKTYLPAVRQGYLTQSLKTSL